MSVEIIKNKTWSKDHYFYSIDLKIGEEVYDPNFFTDSGSSLKNMKISKDGTKLTIIIASSWYDTIQYHDMIAILKGEFKKNGVVFPFKEITFKLVDDEVE